VTGITEEDRPSTGPVADRIDIRLCQPDGDQPLLQRLRMGLERLQAIEGVPDLDRDLRVAFPKPLGND
jgi:hypothetical protein